jgi:hypothetical protein
MNFIFICLAPLIRHQKSIAVERAQSDAQVLSAVLMQDDVSIDQFIATAVAEKNGSAADGEVSGRSCWSV